MLVAVDETASGSGKTGQGEHTGERQRAAIGCTVLFALRQVAFAVLLVACVTPTLVDAQVVPLVHTRRR